MKLAGQGEDGLIAAWTRGLVMPPDVRAGIGDDCAVIGKPRERVWRLLKTDCLVEGIHFDRKAEPERVGWKALCRALSDIAAMGGTPRFALSTIAISGDVSVSWAHRLNRGLRLAARRYGVTIVGGETSRSPGPLFLSITLEGEVERQRCVLRSGGRPGDLLYVTGRLGGSIRGRHLRFEPRLAEARWLTKHFRLRAMMDLSDGLGADLPRLARASECGFEIRAEQLPRNRGCTPANALSDGEDYELLFAIAPRDAKTLEASWRKEFPRLPITPVGRLISPTPNSDLPSPKLRGFDHFAQSR